MLNVRIYSNSEGNNNFFIIYELLFHIIIILSIFLSYWIANSKNFSNIENNENINTDTKRYLEDIIDEEKINNFSLIMKGLTKSTYKGKWKSIYDKEYSDNYIFLSFKKYQNTQLKTEIRQITKNYLTNWNRIIGYIEEYDLEYNKEENIIQFKANGFKVNVESGKIINSIYSFTDCFLDLELDFEILENNNLNFKEIKGNIYSMCNDISNSEIIIKKNTYVNYFLIFFLSSILIVGLNNLNTFLVRNRFDEVYANGISLITIYENIRHYLCFVQLLFILIIDLKKYIFLFWIALFINYPFIDMRFFNLIWRIKYKEQLSNPNTRKKIMCKSMFSFFFFTFFSLLSVSRFYFTKENMLINSILTFFPQIIYNIIYKNEISIPYSICFTFFISKFYIIIYFYLYKDNILLISTNTKLIIIVISIHLISFFLLFTQQIFGPRWFIPCEKRNKPKNIFKYKNEILQIKPELINEDCVICLNPLFKQETEIEKEKYELSQDFNNPRNIEKKKLNERNEENNKIKCSWKDFFLSLFEFQDKNFKFIISPYIFLECHHCFHFNCVLSWIKKKKLCPICRSKI